MWRRVVFNLRQLLPGDAAEYGHQLLPGDEDDLRNARWVSIPGHQILTYFVDAFPGKKRRIQFVVEFNAEEIDS